MANSFVNRCEWADSAPDYIVYHDTEWGVPIRNDFVLYERLVLEGFQSGLSWLTILRKRENFRKAFCNFAVLEVAKFTEKDVTRLLTDSGIIRHRGKIEAAIKNARALLAQWESHGQNWLTQTLLDAAPTDDSLRSQGFVRPPRAMAHLPAKCEETEKLSKHLKRLNFAFVGPTTLYAGLQAAGFVNDHVTDCDLYARFAHKE